VRQWHPRLGTSTDEAIRTSILIVALHFDVKIMVRSEEELHHVLPHIAAKLNIPLDQLERQILSGSAAIVERRPDTVGHHLAFGGEDALRSIAKSCLVLLATKVGSDASP
jgi:hypothetical protein